MTLASATQLSSEGGCTWVGAIEPGWDILGVTNGGYLMAMMGRAMTNMAEDRQVVTMSAHFTRPATAGPVRIDVDMVKEGKSFTTFRADMTAENGTLLSALGTLAPDDRHHGWTVLGDGSPPELPPPEECVRAVPSSEGPLPPPFVGKVMVLIHPDDAVALKGRPTGIPRFRGWFRLLDDEPLDSLAVLLAADAFPPAIFNVDLPLGWTPTLEMTTHVRNPRPSGWLRCAFRTRFLTGDLVEEDGEIWDESGSLVGQSRQLALVPRLDQLELGQ